jgi:hypothetical protein
MQTNELVRHIQINQGAKIVKAFYGETLQNQSYSFLNACGIALKENDQIVVQTKDTFKIVTVLDPDQSIQEIRGSIADLQHVVDKIDLDRFLSVTVSENTAISALAMSEVTSRLEAYREQLGNDIYDKINETLSITSNVTETKD